MISGCDEFQCGNEFDQRFVLIMFACNQDNTNIDPRSRWTIEFATHISNLMTANLTGGVKKKKHHESVGKYYGFEDFVDDVSLICMFLICYYLLVTHQF